MAVAGYYLGKALYKVSEYESIIDLIEIQPHIAQELSQQLGNEPSVLSAAYEYAKKNISSEDVARIGTKTVLDMMLLHGITKAVSAIAKESWAEFISCMRKGEQSSDIVLTAENISVQCGEEIASVMENMQKAGSGTGVVKISSRAQKALDAFKITEYDSVIGDLNVLEAAIEKLQNVPGALENNGPLLKVLELGKKGSKPGQLNAARGAMYEVEKAMKLIECGEEIMCLGLRLKGTDGVREFDIVTETKLIECKDIDWLGKTKKDISDIYGQFGEQLAIAKTKNMVFQVCSKNVIPFEVKDWFIKNGIRFFEG